MRFNWLLICLWFIIAHAMLPFPAECEGDIRGPEIDLEACNEAQERWVQQAKQEVAETHPIGKKYLLGDCDVPFEPDFCPEMERQGRMRMGRSENNVCLLSTSSAANLSLKIARVVFADGL